MKKYVDDVLALTRAATEQALSGGDGPMGPKPTTHSLWSGRVGTTGASPASGSHVTTNATIADDLRASLRAHQQHTYRVLMVPGGGVQAGHTWADFKLAMHALGVIDSDAIASIEYGCGKTASGILVREDASDGIEIRETR